MGVETTLFKSEEKLTRAEVVAALRQIADKLETGTLTLRKGEQTIALEIPGRVELELQVEDEDKGERGIQHSLEIELSWFDGDEDHALEIG